MTAAVLGPPPTRRATGRSLPRLLGHGPDLAAHLGRYGPMPSSRAGLVDALARAGLKGKGGAGFPTARKITTVAAGKKGTVAVANGTEGEPLSAKDKILLTQSPHLVLDGLALAGDLVGAHRRVLCVERGNPAVEPALRRALSERDQDEVEVEILTTPRRYVSGQETALVDLINGGQGKPSLARPFERGVDGLPTLVDNVETLAHLALIARYGADWYREVGTADDPGTTLVTIAGSVSRPGVYEIAPGWAVEDVLAHAGAGQPRAVLFGGYYGRWAGAQEISGLRLDAASLRKARLSLGCGVVAVIDDDICAVAEAARVAAWFAASSAGQCGACLWGLRDLARGAINLASGNLASGRADPSGSGRLLRWTDVIENRGACGLPDGAVAFLRSALDVFADEVHDHIAGACARSRRQLLPTPMPEPWK